MAPSSKNDVRKVLSETRTLRILLFVVLTMMSLNRAHLLLLACSTLLPGAVSAAEASSQSLYLKEILQGRCYFAPPAKGDDRSTCPALVGSIMNVFESNLDANIGPSSFDDYLEQADFSSPADQALFVLHFLGESSAPPLLAPPPGLVSPEDTPGGALFKGLAFCGVDQQGNCSIEKSNAYWQFWEAAYAKFASQVQGHVRIVMEPMADAQFLQRSAIANFPQGQVSSVTIYMAAADDAETSCASSKGVAKLQTALKQAGIQDLTCKDNLMDLYVDTRGTIHVPTTSTTTTGGSSNIHVPTSTNSNTEEEPATTTDDSDEPNDTTTPSEQQIPKKGGFFHGLFLLCIVAGVVFAVYNYFQAAKNHGESPQSFRDTALQAARDMYSDLTQVAQKIWTLGVQTWNRLMLKAGGSYSNIGDTSDVENNNNNKSENSPLVNNNNNRRGDGAGTGNGENHHDFFLAPGTPPNQVVLQ